MPFPVIASLNRREAGVARYWARHPKVYHFPVIFFIWQARKHSSILKHQQQALGLIHDRDVVSSLHLSPDRMSIRSWLFSEPRTPISPCFIFLHPAS